MTRIVAEPPTDQPYAQFVQTGRFTWQVTVHDHYFGFPLCFGTWTVFGYQRARAKADRELRKHSTAKARKATQTTVVDR